MTKIAFTVDGKPIAQPRPSFSRAGNMVRAYVPKKHPVHAYRMTCKMYARQTMEARGLECLTCPVEIRLVFALPLAESEKRVRTPRQRAHHTKKPDLDNLEKAVCDALSGVVWQDDRQIVRVTATKYQCAQGEPPYTLVEVSPASDILPGGRGQHDTQVNYAPLASGRSGSGISDR